MIAGDCLMTGIQENWLQQASVFQVLDQLPFRIFWTNKKDFFLGCNKAFYASLGFSSAKSVIGHSVHEFPYTETETTTLPLLNEESEVVGVWVLYNDIIPFKKNELEENRIEEKRYWQQKDFLLELLAQLPVHVFWKNEEGVYLGCNKAFYESLGLSSSDEIVGRTDYDLSWTKAESDIYRADDRAVIESRIPKLNIEEPQTLENGKKITLLTSKVPLISKSGKVMGVLGIYTDITERKAMEKREKDAIEELAHQRAHLEAEEILRRSIMILTGSIAHDLRTPLTATLLKLDLLSRQEAELRSDKLLLADQPDMKEKLEKHIEVTIENLNGIKKIMYEMNTFIDVTLKSMQRLVSGTLSVEDFTVCSVEACLYEVIIKYPFKAHEKALLHTTEVEDFCFKGIAVLFYRILFNLIGNALQQIEQNGRGEIYIKTSRGEKYNHLHVRDTAGGVSQAVLGTLFDDFKSTKKNGTGIGLAYCKLTMESFGGSISAHSVEGDYIEFILSFPYC